MPSVEVRDRVWVERPRLMGLGFGRVRADGRRVRGEGRGERAERAESWGLRSENFEEVEAAYLQVCAHVHTCVSRHMCIKTHVYQDTCVSRHMFMCT